MAQAMRLILMGPPGCGKGTQGVRLQAKYHVPWLSAGDMLRAAVRDRTSVGMAAKKHMDSGGLVPDDLIVKVVGERLEASDCESGYILDGFPRTVVQAEELEGMVAKKGHSLLAAINIEVPDEVVVERLSGRRQCSSCGANFHLVFHKSKVADTCDQCGGKLIQRSDDNEDTVRQRLKVYIRQTAPLVDFYDKRGLLLKVNGRGSVDEVFERLCSLIERKVSSA